MMTRSSWMVSALITLLLLTPGCTRPDQSSKPKVQQMGQSTDIPQVRLVIDSKDTDKMPKHFRKTSDPLQATSSTPMPTTQGLAELRASGSAEFTEKGLANVKKAIGAGPNMTIVDLRQESHGFVNGMAVSWVGKNDEANLGLSYDEVLAKERQQLDGLKNAQTIAFDKLPSKSGQSDRTTGETVVPHTVLNEEELVRASGLNYARFTVTDHLRPLNDQVDRFVTMVNGLPSDAWLHFHCRAGVGRTTTFLAMYDMMRNAKQVSFDDIMHRQAMIGGKNFLRDDKEDDQKYSKNGKTNTAEERVAFLQSFYQYCKTNNDGFKTSYSVWASQQK